MPFQEVGDSAGALGSIIGLAGGYLAGNNRRKKEQEQQQYERGRQSASDQRANQELAIQTQAATQRTEDWDTQRTHQALIAGALGNLEKQVPKPKGDPAKDPGSWQKYYLEAGNFMAQYDLSEAKKYWDAAGSITREQQQASAAQVNQARIPLLGAQTSATDALVPLRAAQTTNTLDLPGSRARHDADTLEANQARITAAQVNAANAQAQAWARFNMGQNNIDRRFNETRSDRKEVQAERKTEKAAANPASLTPFQQSMILNVRSGQTPPDMALAAITRGPGTPEQKKAAEAMIVGGKVRGPAPKAAKPELEATHAMEQKPAFKALPGGVQAAIIKKLKAGVSPQGIILDVQNAPDLKPEQKQAVVQALQ